MKFNKIKKIQRILQAHTRNKPRIRIITKHQDDLPLARSLEKLLDYVITTKNNPSY
jgi:hypothetical protein